MDLDDVLAGGFALVLPHLTERQRRLLLGGFARVLGHGGVTRVAELAGSTRPTVRRGMAELDSDRAGPGAGRGTQAAGRG